MADVFYQNSSTINGTENVLDKIIVPKSIDDTADNALISSDNMIGNTFEIKGDLHSLTGNAVEIGAGSGLNTINIAGSATLRSDSGFAVHLEGSAEYLNNAGQLFGLAALVVQGAHNTIENSGEIQSTAAFGYGIYFESGTQSLINSGLIAADFLPVYAITDFLTVVNSGQIIGDYGIAFASSANITNSGLISSNGESTLLGLPGTLRLTNTGTVKSLDTFAIETGTSIIVNKGVIKTEVTNGIAIYLNDDSSITNHKKIIGDVVMGSGELVFKNVGKGFVKGGVYGSGSDDTLIGGKKDDVFYAGNGADHIYTGKGDDTVQGGLGIDTFHFMQKANGITRITDFVDGTDLLHLDKVADVNKLINKAAKERGDDLVINLEKLGGKFEGKIILEDFVLDGGTLDALDFV